MNENFLMHRIDFVGAKLAFLWEASLHVPLRKDHPIGVSGINSGGNRHDQAVGLRVVIIIRGKNEDRSFFAGT
ncbi:MAG: hypothetical protein A3G38_02250 [Omnitrophica WOR_2 bacterium RIFCSPLOWO2_12_FULL_51_8]|nr:MAG: hypothetical protein A3G38_02250 [Omnitrophica WOR_2 bacterium RIFCSPLOWO2_12_FULL_51_8]